MDSRIPSFRGEQTAAVTLEQLRQGKPVGEIEPHRADLKHLTEFTKRFERVEFEKFCPPAATGASNSEVESRYYPRRKVLSESGINYVEVANEAAFYGPKIDVQVWSAIGREFTIATNQVDFAVPAKFGLTYRDKDNSNKTPLCIHRAPLGTHERFIGFLIEHYAGNFPLWLAPDQVRVITLNDDEALINYAQPIVAELRANMVRVDADFSATPLKAKISNAERL
jgi:threonyl-tRNA synthetase